MQSETPEDERSRVPRHAPVCFCVSENWGARGPWEARKRGVAHMLPFHMPGGGPENTPRKRSYCTGTVDEALYLKLTILKWKSKIQSYVHAQVSLLVMGGARIQTQFIGYYVISLKSPNFGIFPDIGFQLSPG